MRVYANSSPRIRAALIDSLVVFWVLVAGLVMIDALMVEGPMRRAASLLVLLVAVLYEPVMVSVWGATIGHRKANIHVVDERTQGRIGLAKSLLRFLVKMLMGWLSLIAITVSSKKLAMHDMLTASSVQIKHPSAGSIHLGVLDENIEQKAGEISALRRGLVILAYLIVSYIVVSVVMAFFVSPMCLEFNRCSPTDKLRLSVSTLGLIGLFIVLIFLGAKSRLWGCRPSRADR